MHIGLPPSPLQRARATSTPSCRWARVPALRALRALALLLAGVVPLVADAVIPESGIYVPIGRPGEAWLIEHQNGKVAALLMSYRLDRQPEFYFASGDLVKGVVDTEVLLNGDEIGHRFTATLMQSRSDVPMGLHRVPRLLRLDAKPVGLIHMEFVHGGAIQLSISRDDVLRIVAPEDESLSIESTQYLLRFNFGHQPFGFSGADLELQCSINREGDWVFLDETDPMLPPWRFRFVLEAPVVVPPPGNGNCLSSLPDVVYVDRARSAKMVCDRLEHCSVIQNGQPLFYFHQLDVGIDRMIGYRGSRVANVVRTEQTVVGVRIAPSGQQP